MTSPFVAIDAEPPSRSSCAESGTAIDAGASMSTPTSGRLVRTAVTGRMPNRLANAEKESSDAAPHASTPAAAALPRTRRAAGIGRVGSRGARRSRQRASTGSRTGSGSIGAPSTGSLDRRHST